MLSIENRGRWVAPLVARPTWKLNRLAKCIGHPNVLAVCTVYRLGGVVYTPCNPDGTLRFLSFSNCVVALISLYSRCPLGGDYTFNRKWKLTCLTVLGVCPSARWHTMVGTFPVSRSLVRDYAVECHWSTWPCLSHYLTTWAIYVGRVCVRRAVPDTHISETFSL